MFCGDFICFDDEFKVVEALIVNQDIETITRILQKRRDLSTLINGVGQTLMHLAVTHRRIDLIHWLLQNNVEVDSIDFAKKTGLHLAVSLKFEDVVECLLNNNAKIHAKDNYGTSPFHLAVINGSISLIQTFLDHGADVMDVTSKNRETCFHIALLSDNFDVFNLLLQSYNGSMDVSNAYGETILHLLARKKSKSLVQKVLERNVNINIVNQDQNTPLHVATQERNHWLIEMYLKYGAKVNVKNKYDECPLHIAIRNKDVAIVKLLLSYGADAKILSSNNNSTLHLVMNHFDYKIFEILLQLDMDINTNNGDNYTPFHLAISNKNKYAAKTLLKRGADINSMSSKTWVNYQQFNKMDWAHYKNLTPLQTAIVQKDVDLVNFLLNNGAKVDFENQTETFLAVDVGSSTILEILFNRGADLNKVNKEGESLLYRAVQYCNIKLVQTLLFNGADMQEILQMDEADVPALHLAVKSHQEKFVNFLLELGADVNAIDSRRNTALHYAEENNSSIAEILIKYLAIIKIDNGFINEPNQNILDTFPHCKTYFFKCMAELDSLKEINCCGYPMTNFLTKSVNTLTKLLRNKDVYFEFFTAIDCQRYPIYCQILVSKMSDTLKRGKLVKKAADILNSISCLNPLYDVTDKILDNFTIGELELFIENAKSDNKTVL